MAVNRSDCRFCRQTGRSYDKSVRCRPSSAFITVLDNLTGAALVYDRLKRVCRPEAPSSRSPQQHNDRWVVFKNSGSTFKRIWLDFGNSTTYFWTAGVCIAAGLLHHPSDFSTGNRPCRGERRMSFDPYLFNDQLQSSTKPMVGWNNVPWMVQNEIFELFGCFQKLCSQRWVTEGKT